MNALWIIVMMVHANGTYSAVTAFAEMYLSKNQCETALPQIVEDTNTIVTGKVVVIGAKCQAITYVENPK